MLQKVSISDKYCSFGKKKKRRKKSPPCVFNIEDNSCYADLSKTI